MKLIKLLIDDKVDANMKLNMELNSNPFLIVNI